MSANQEKIALLNSAKASKAARIAILAPSESDWRRDSTRECRGSGQKKRDCEKERQNSLVIANQRLAEINQLKSDIASIDLEIAVLVEADRANNQANVTLANQGISMEALSKAAEGQNEAAKIKAAAEAEAIKTTATTQADNSRNNNMVFIAVAVVVVVVVAFVLFKKFKKKK